MPAQDQKTSTTVAPTRGLTSEEFSLISIRRRLVQFESLLLLERLGHDLSEEEQSVVAMVRAAMVRLDTAGASAAKAVRSLAALVKLE